MLNSILQEMCSSKDREWGSDLGLFLSGLFSFYQFAAFEVKDQFLNIIDSYIVSFDKELLLSLPGFMICMIPALEDQNADKLKKVEEILKKTEQYVGTSEFYGEIWKAMLRTNRTRLSAIKYLEKRIPKDLDAARELVKKDQIYISRFKIKVAPYKNKDGIMETRVTLQQDEEREKEEKEKLALKSLEDYYYFYYPMKQKLCINSLLAGLADQSNYVTRGVMDFLISHIPITGKVNNELENVKLLEGALNTLFRRDYAFLKKFFTWVLGHLEDDDDYQPNDSDPAIKTLVPALKCLYKRFIDKNELQKHYQKEKQGQQPPQNIPILITQALLNDNTVIIEPILLQISVDLIKYIKFFINDKKDPKLRFRENVFNLFDMVQNQLSCIWTALGELLSKEINENKVENTYQIQAIELIDFCLIDLREFFQKQSESSNISDYLRPILSSLLSGVLKLSNNMKNLENAIPALDLIQRIISFLDADTLQQEHMIDLEPSSNEFNSFYIKLCTKMMNFQEIAEDGTELFKLRLDTFKKASEILTSIQEYSNYHSLHTMPQWLVSVISCSKTRIAKIALVSSETFLNILSKKCYRPRDPIKRLQDLIVLSNDNINQSMIDNISDQLSFSQIDDTESKNSRTMSQSFMSHGSSFSQIDNDIYKTLQDTRNIHCTNIIKTLWSLLDQEEDHQKIVTLLKKFDKLLPAIFSEVVINDLIDKGQREVIERGIKKFSIFWNLTAQDYPSYRPFVEPFGEKDTNNRRYVALHNVLHFLEQNDPTLRLSCKSWLSESKLYYNRILDPLIEEFLQNSKVFVTFTKQIFFCGHYDTKIVSENFGKLLNIILNTQDEMINYMITKPSTEYIQKEFQQMFKWMQPKPIFGEKFKYLEIIVYITVQFIMGQAVQSFDNTLYQESQTVNASACEFMELILKYLEVYKIEFEKIANQIVEPILRTFRQVIDNQNNAMQVHLLNLLKVIFFQNNNSFLEQNQDCKVFKDSSLIDSLIKGLKNEVSFVRFHFIQFVQTIMKPMKKKLDKEVFKENVNKLIDCFCELMKHIDVSLFASQHTASAGGSAKGLGNEIFNRESIKYNNRNSNSQFGVAQKSAKAHGKLVINQENDIAQLIQGFKNTLMDALSIYKPNEVDGSQFQQQNLNINIDSTPEYKQVGDEGLVTKIKGIFGNTTEGPVRTNNDEQNVRDAILANLKKIIVSCLHCWNDLAIFTPRDFHFSRSGVFPYFQSDEMKMNEIIEAALFIKYKEQTQINDTSRSTLTRDTSTIQMKSGVEFTLSHYIWMKINPIQSQILEFLRPLMDTSSVQLIEGFLMVWMDKKNLDGAGNFHKSLEKLMQLLQSVRSVKIRHFNVVECLVHLIEKLKWKTQPPRSKKKITLDQFEVTRETLLCQFLYTYLLYNAQQMFPKGNVGSMQYDDASVSKLYKAVWKFIQCFKESRHPPTQCWLLEIINILSIKFQPMDAYRGDQKLKKDFSELLTDLLEQTAQVFNDSQKIEYSKDYGFLIAFPPQVYELLKRFSPKYAEYISQFMPQQNAKKKIESKPTSELLGPKKQGMQQQQISAKMQPIQGSNTQDDVDDGEELKSDGGANLGINTNISLKIGMENSQQDILFGGSSSSSGMNLGFSEADYPNSEYFFDERMNISKFMCDLANCINMPPINNQQVQWVQYHRFFVIITLKSCLFNMVQSIVGGSASHTASDKISASLKIIVDEILKILNKKEDKEYKDLKVFIREAVTDFFAALMDNANYYLVKRYRQEIQDIFFSDNFFQMSRRNLRKWCKIINHFISENKDAVFDDLLYRWNTQAGLLTSKDTENKQKMIALKRVSFLVYSGNMDQYVDKLDILLKKMTEGFKVKQKIPLLQTQLFLLTRVLCLRLQTTTLNDALRKLWPHILSELEHVFSKKEKFEEKGKGDNKNREDHTAIIEAIKVVDMMSALNIEDFQMNQWIFLIDSYGMRHKGDPSLIQNKNQGGNNSGNPGGEGNDFTMIDKPDGGIFQPFIIKYILNSECTFNDQTTIRDKGMSVDDYLGGSMRQIEQRRSAIQKDRKDYEYDQVLETFTLRLQCLLNESNTERYEIDRENFEEFIEKDFIEPESSK